MKKNLEEEARRAAIVAPKFFLNFNSHDLDSINQKIQHLFSISDTFDPIPFVKSRVENWYQTELQILKRHLPNFLTSFSTKKPKKIYRNINWVHTSIEILRLMFQSIKEGGDECEEITELLDNIYQILDKLYKPLYFADRDIRYGKTWAEFAIDEEDTEEEEELQDEGLFKGELQESFITTMK